MLAQDALFRIVPCDGPNEAQGQRLIDIIQIQSGGLYQGIVLANHTVNAPEMIFYNRITLGNLIFVFHSGKSPSFLYVRGTEEERVPASSVLSPKYEFLGCVNVTRRGPSPEGRR